MSKYNLSELLTEVTGGRIGTLNISARDLVNKMEELEDKGVRVERFDGLSPDGKTYIEFHVHPIRKYDEDYSFSIYDYKFGFDPMSEDHFMEEYPFSVGGRSSALDAAETTLRGGDTGYQIDESINEDEFDEARQAAIESSQEAAGIKENMSKKDSLKKEMMIHVDQLIDGNIDMNDFMNVVEDIMAEANSMKEVMGIDRKGRKKSESESNMTKVNEEEMISKAKYDKLLDNAADRYDELEMQFTKFIKDEYNKDFDIEDFRQFQVDNSIMEDGDMSKLKEHFKRFK
tara:strand:- start:453 stop:1313 length:861 start_codon:yes stop_codon:yes gene_type:complete